MISSQFIRTCSALVAGTALFAGVATAAGAVDSFNVSTTITAACNVTNAGPGNLFPTYTPSTDASTGAETTLNTFCSGTTPTVTFSDAAGNTDGPYVMSDGNGNNLTYQLSNTPSCTGVAGDNNMGEGDPETLTATFDICAAVIVGGPNTAVPAGTYNDVVTYTITP